MKTRSNRTMMRDAVALGAAAILAAAASTETLAQQVEPSRPELVRGELRARAASGDLASQIRGVGGDAWIGYAVPRVAGHHQHCGDRVVSLDGNGWNGGSDDELEEVERGPLFVLYRVTGGAISKIRTLGSGCRVDAGPGAGVLHWLEGVSPRASLELLATIGQGDVERVGKQAAAAIAFHADGHADRLLGELATSAPLRDVREQAIFWLGSARGEAGFVWLSRRAEVETDRKLKEKIVFALHVSDASGATAKLVELARGDSDRRVREKAIFWLSQEAGARAASTIASAVVDDPDVEVKKKAVFALSQLPPDEGVPLLLEVAETHPNPEVRKKAFFWLGQTGDPRAAALFERILLER